MMNRFFLSVAFLSFVFVPPALADQAYIQSSPWVVNRLPVMKGQDTHQRCVLQSSFTGVATLQFVTENKMVRGAIFILTEPVLEEEGRNIDVTVTVGSKSYEFPARSLSKYALAVDISESYAPGFTEKLSNAELLRLKSGFSTFNFSLQSPRAPLENAVACALPTPKPAPAPVIAAPPPPPVVASPPAEPVPAPIATAPEAAPIIAPPVKEPAPIVAAPLPVAAPVETVETAETVEKVDKNAAHIVNMDGRDVVLAEALPMLLPPGYNYRVAQGALPGDRISWDKGQDWLPTLVMALDDIGLQAAVSNQTLTIMPKIKSISLKVAQQNTPPRAPIILKEPDVMPIDESSLLKTDLSAPPSPGLQEEALVALAKLRLDALQELLENAKKPEPETPVDMAPPAPPEKAPEKPPETVFKARKGERLQDVIARWSGDAGQPTDLALQRDYFLPRDMNVQGDYDLALDQALAQFSDIPDAPRVLADGEPPPAQVKTAYPEVPLDPVEERLGAVARWSAAESTSLRAALSNWARQGRMQLVWNGDQDLIIPHNVAQTARLDQALDGLIGQYDKQELRPLVSINRDPDTGLVAMIVDVMADPTNAKATP